jgi:O-antigen/teichoic acid export membrane protein
VALFGAVFGMEFEAGDGVAALLLATACLLAPYYALVPALIASGRIRTLMWVSLAAALVNIVIDILLVTPIGIWAAAVGTAAQTSLATAALVLDAFGPRALPRLTATAVVPLTGLGVLAAWPDSPLVLAAVAAVAVASLALTARANPVPVLAGLKGIGLARS